MGHGEREAPAQERTNHVTFVDGDGGSEDGDEDGKPVEVTFEPGNSHRRKSSLVSSEAATLRIQRSSRRDQCIVHQFLESRAKGAAGNGSGPASRAHSSNPSPTRDHGVENTGDRRAADPLVESNGQESQPHRCRALLDPASLDAARVGQADQQAWTREMTGNMSDSDLAQQYDVVHSRMLTKKQLSDMAWGVRELSRRLSSMRIRIRVKTIFILTKVYDQDLIVVTRELTRWLLDKGRPVPFVVYVQDKLRTNKKFDGADVETTRHALERRLRYWDEDMCRSRPHTFDFVITLGGDGTVLYASWLFQRIVPPVLSFALGSLGFLTKFDFDDFVPTLNAAFDRGVTVSLRLRFESTVMRSIRRKGSDDGKGSEEDEDEAHGKRDLVEELIGEEREDAHTHRPDGAYEILNEVVVDRGPNPTMSYTEVFGDDEHFTSVLADGICVSTPTGSTAYNLAAGGSLCHPENPVMLLTSICAHTLSFRPIILPDTIVLRVGVPYDARTSSWASFDGRERVELRPGDYVTISASRYPFASVQAEGRRSEDWINSISGKLGWNTRQKQKGYKEWAD
ncbi:ATP-NAD kinase domain-containing protein [Hirsutella rhossiliensis]|uniref:ATP-NAD kinase domain-containing protein n=1 Tax=Hirsutella rhossiliensis TaxID=111463 RepID=A0A9P8N5H1_9HYPO|nr:ATP-NAD kinase domain-containing protein [Hirsutella rhossiliensis]KAH0965007.1 ATP-NAD kinase domain-containing protein [Hirsutella rhossiliensis]